MEGFALLLGHLVGDYLLQSDWQASLKGAPHPGPRPEPGGTDEDAARLEAWELARRAWRVGFAACAWHCTLYTLGVFALSFWWMPWWGLLLCWLLHYPIDRFRLARLWMTRVARQESFATGPFAPFSVVIIDNTFHLLALLLIAYLAGRFI